MPPKRNYFRGRPRTHNQLRNRETIADQDNLGHGEMTSENQIINAIIGEDNEMSSLTTFDEIQHCKLPAINLLLFSGRPETLNFFISQLAVL